MICLAMPTVGRTWAKRLRAWGRMLLLAAPRRVECVVCGWRGRRFLDDSWHRDVGCPKCGSSVRHRLLVAAHRHLEGLSFAAIYGGRRVLHIAPEATVGRLIRPVAAAYVRGDYLHEGVDIRVDITDMRDVADGAHDVVIACDVLEHVSDFRRALSEIHRVLSRGGLAVLTVPQQDDLPVTREDPSLITDEQRRQAFGQHDHVRMFGDDFTAELERHGFAVTLVDAASFPRHLVARYRLEPERSAHPLATNHRRVFFCRRQGERSL